MKEAPSFDERQCAVQKTMRSVLLSNLLSMVSVNMSKSMTKVMNKLKALFASSETVSFHDIALENCNSSDDEKQRTCKTFLHLEEQALNLYIRSVEFCENIVHQNMGGSVCVPAAMLLSLRLLLSGVSKRSMDSMSKSGVVCCVHSGTAEKVLSERRNWRQEIVIEKLKSVHGLQNDGSDENFIRIARCPRWCYSHSYMSVQ